MSAKIKRALSLILSLVMIFGVFSAAGEGIGFSGIMNVTASAGERLPYSINNNKVTITNPNYYIDENGDAVIPERIERLPVTAIRGGFGSPILKTVYIPKSVTSIENYVYYKFNPLSFESIIDGLSHIFKHSIFGNCPNLETITIAEDNPVYHSSGNCIIETESKTLVSGCASSVIPDDGSVTSIGDFAFCGVKGLKNIYIPSSIERIGVSPFSLGDDNYFCLDVESITVSENNPHYHSAGNCLIETETGRLVSGCKNSVIPDDGSVTAIGDYAFSQVDSFESVIIPDSVSLIGEGAFLYSIDLESVFIPNSVTVIGRYAFADCKRIQSISIPDSVTDIGYAAFAECDELVSISFGSGLRNIESMEMTQLAGGGYSFNDLFNFSTKLESITVSPDNPVFHSSGNCLIETDTKTLIAGCKNSVIPNDGSVLTIGVAAFINCEGLRSVAIPDSVTVIDSYAFNGCCYLDNISFGSGISHIGGHNFAYYSDQLSPNYISEVFYNGTREEWETIIIDEYNYGLNYANIHFNDGTMTFADYSALDALIATIPEDLSVYTEDSVTVLNEVLGSIVRDLPAEEQATVDGYVESLTAAIGSLYFEPFASISTTQVIRGERATWTVTTPLNVMWLRFTCNYTTAGGASGKTVLSLKYGNTYSGSTEFSVKEENGMRIWTVSMPFTYPGTSASATQNWKVEYKRRGSSVWETARILSGTKWKAKAGIKEYSQEVLVAKNAEMFVPAIPGYEKFTLLGSIADKEAGTFTVVTTDDVSKIRISYTDANTGKTKSYAYQTTSTSVISRENHDGLTVWVVKYKFNAPAEDDIYTVSVRGPAWGEGKTATVW